MFARLRARARRWWVAPAASTFFANILDTYTFYGVAFYRADDEFMAANWVALATVDLAFKIVVSVVIFLPMYGRVVALFASKVTLLNRYLPTS